MCEGFLMSFLIRVIVNALALAVAVWIVPGIHIDSVGDDTLGLVVSYR